MANNLQNHTSLVFGLSIPDSAPTDIPVATSTPACVTPSVRCPGSSRCISQHQLCDGQRDCPDGFDEKECIVKCENTGESATEGIE